MPAISQVTFQMHFLENKKVRILIKILLKFVSKGPINHGFVPNRQQAIIWTNAHPILWHIYAALGEMS